MKEKFKEHNENVRRIWESFYAGKPERVPVIIGINPRYWLLNARLNKEKISFKDYSTDAECMAEVQLQFFSYIRHNLYADHEMGIPENGWHIYVDLQNYYEAAWFGADIIFCDDNCPSTATLLDDDNKFRLFESGIPDPFGSYYETALSMYEKMGDMIGRRVFLGKPVTGVGLPSYCTDGPMTVACNLRGADKFCIDIYDDPSYAEQLLDYITDATIARIKAWNKRFSGSEITDSFYFADDSIQLLSCDMYRDLVLPRHKRLISELSSGKYSNSIHLCGDASRHFQMIRDELNVFSFDTGFPVNHENIVKQLGPDVTIQGGPSMPLLLHGTPEAVAMECRRILKEVMPHTKKFILRDANNIAPGVPLENIKAMYDTAVNYGQY